MVTGGVTAKPRGAWGADEGAGAAQEGTSRTECIGGRMLSNGGGKKKHLTIKSSPKVSHPDTSTRKTHVGKKPTEPLTSCHVSNTRSNGPRHTSPGTHISLPLTILTTI
ncbi:hypothetical protein ACLOJK_012862 [Asimina triloba]